MEVNKIFISELLNEMLIANLCCICCAEITEFVCQGVPSFSTLIFHDQKLRKSITYVHWIGSSCGLSVTIYGCRWLKIGCLQLKVDARLSTTFDDSPHSESLFYDTIRYDSVYLTCSKKLTGSQLSLPHGINKTLKCETKNKMMSVIGPVQSRYREAVQ